LGSRSSRSLRTGYTTGACAAAAAKAATLALLQKKTGSNLEPENGIIEIPFPDGSRHGLKIGWINCGGYPQGMFASVVKDAGDDPDITNGAEIQAKVVFASGTTGRGRRDEGTKGDSGGHLDSTACRFAASHVPPISIKGGRGVGKVTRPGLPVPIGKPAINPGPQRMIREAVIEALRTATDKAISDISEIEITIWVPEGESIARKTLNPRLGILGGISILGTTGIVRPLSAEAWTATISTSMDVARAMERKEIVVSSGRNSEKAHVEKYALPEECYIMMGDYVEYSLLEARKHGFSRTHLVSQWAKMLKTAPQTHVRHGAIDLGKVSSFLTSLGLPELAGKSFNTAREIFDLIATSHPDACLPLLTRVCRAAREYAESLSEMPVTVHLVSYNGGIITHDG
jgi:cobalt-precorrin-5B (C1)-methyltransferase